MAFFPDEARDEGVDGASVRLRVHVGPDGRVVDARAEGSDGHGFARAAERALRSGACEGTAARDREGHAVVSVVSFTVRFELAQ